VKLIRRKKRAQLADVVELLTGFGRMFQTIDAKLEQIVELLREEDDDE
jgi:hypothetical protein